MYILDMPTISKSVHQKNLSFLPPANNNQQTEASSLAASLAKLHKLAGEWW